MDDLTLADIVGHTERCALCRLRFATIVNCMIREAGEPPQTPP